MATKTVKDLPLQVNLFGPGTVPLLRPHTTTLSLSPVLLADWEQYGIALEIVPQASPQAPSASPRDSAPQALLSALHYRAVSRTGCAGSHRRGVLQVFVFLQHTGHWQRVIGENSHWARNMDAVCAVRKDLPSLVSVHSAQFHHAMHSALNRLLYNHTAQAEVCRGKGECVVCNLSSL